MLVGLDHRVRRPDALGHLVEALAARRRLEFRQARMIHRVPVDEARSCHRAVPTVPPAPGALFMLKRLVLAASLAALAASLPAHAQGVIKIGEINSYKAQPAFLEPYKKGMELAVEEINAAGGVNGKKLAADHARRQRQPGRRGARGRGAGVAREGRRAGRHLPVEHRPGGDRLRQAEEVLLPRRRAAHRQDHLAERQPLHLPPAPRHLHAGRDAGARGGQAEEEALGGRLPQLRIRPVGGRRPSRRC